MRRTIFHAGALIFAWVGAVAPAVGGDGPQYRRDVRPILADACFRCHGPGVKKAGLRLDRREDALKPTESGAVPIAPGKPSESELVRRILSDDETEVMPPPKARKRLTPEQKDILRRWVEQGAEYQKHWSFDPPTKPPVPKVDASGVRVANPIDAFIADRLLHEQLTMAPEADRETLIRRVAFATTGLPPTVEEIDTFLSDTSKKAYDNMVERYLFSPRFGEEMARHWLDVARYADTHGLHLDNERQMWLYRDWVVRAFNDNLSFDRFTVEQIAGDLLPQPSRDELIATGFNRCNVSTSEGGSIEAEWTFRNAVDRTSTMVEAWMGLTAGCAVCHDHKFDPLSAEEFYSLYAFFYSAAGPALDGNSLLHDPILKNTTPAQETRLAELAREIDQTRRQIDEAYQKLAYQDPAEPAAQQAGPGGVGSGSAAPAATDADPRQSLRAWEKQGDGPLAKDAPADVKALLKKAKDGTLPPDGEKRLREYYLQNVCEATKGTFRPLLETVSKLTKERADLDASIPGTFIFKDMDQPRDAFVMVRGQYDKPGKKVEPNTPAVFPPLAKAKPDGRATRLDLAHWLVAPEHPLTARVAANRLWQQFFGTGLVKTSFDFGSQGELPSHPELLDWLAVSFREGGWDVKALVRLFLTSATFRQASQVRPELHARDPENRLYARGPRFRLDAEQVRDNALFVSGLIRLEMGGKGVKPYQPPKIWEPVAFTGSNTMVYQQDHGPALYRRSLYTFLKRTAPPPFLANFDAPSPKTSEGTGVLASNRATVI